MSHLDCSGWDEGAAGGAANDGQPDRERDLPGLYQRFSLDRLHPRSVHSGEFTYRVTPILRAQSPCIYGAERGACWARCGFTS